MRNFCRVLFLFFLLVFFIIKSPTPVFSALCMADQPCLSNGVYNPPTQQYLYTRQICRGTQINSLVCQYNITSTEYNVPYSNPQNTSCSWGCGALSGGNQGYRYTNPTPTLGPGRCPLNGPQGYCSGRSSHVCCTLYNGDCCSSIPSGCKSRLSCPAGGGGGFMDGENGGGPTSCNLSCPTATTSWSSSLGGSGIIQSGLNGVSLERDYTVIPPLAETQLKFEGQNGFVCGSFYDGLNNNTCQFDSGAGTGNVSSRWIYPMRYHMLCGAQSQTYTAAVVERTAGGAGTVSVGGGGPATPVPTNPAGPLYPPGCNPNVTPTLGPSMIPGRSGLTPNPTSGTEVGPTRVPGDTAPNSCSCNVTLGCQRQLYPILTGAGSTCNASCNLSVTPDNPVYNTSVSFGITGAATQLNFDDSLDGSTTVANPSGTVSHTFANAGVYDVSLTCGAQTCTKRMNVYCTYIPKNWYKLKDASFHKISTLQNPIPDPIVAYDNDDTTDRQFIVGTGGIVSGDAGINLGSGAPSANEWLNADYTFSSRFNPATYLEYVTARKHFVALTPTGGVIKSNDLTQNAVNVAVGDYELDSASIQSKSPFVLIVNGDLTINTDINPPEKSLAVFVLGKLKIKSSVDEISGLFFTNAVDFAYDVSAGNTTSATLKVNGNFISTIIADTTKRVSSDIRKPSYFIVFKPQMYTDLLPLLSIRTYEWTQLAN